MITSLKIDNFQSIQHAELELAPYTVLVGESDQGKSAILRSIFGVLFNVGDKAFIRNGAEMARVALTLESGTVEWVLGEKRAYAFTPLSGLGQMATKIGRTVPQEISDLVKASVVDVSGSKLFLQYHSQFDPQLAGASSGLLARLFDKMIGVELLTKSMALARQDVTSSQRSLSAAEQEYDRVEMDLSVASIRLKSLADRVEKAIKLERASKIVDFGTLLLQSHSLDEVMKGLDVEIEELVSDGGCLDLKVDVVYLRDSALDLYKILESSDRAMSEVLQTRLLFDQMLACLEIQELETEIGQLAQQQSDLETEEAGFLEQRMSLVSQLERCPVCDSMLDSGKRKLVIERLTSQLRGL